MPYTPILATLGYVLSPDGEQVLMIHRNARDNDLHLGKYNGLGGKLEADEDVIGGIGEVPEDIDPFKLTELVMLARERLGNLPEVEARELIRILISASRKPQQQ